MEVHAHSHTARKKWTHYFWEFIMLFLAVFCGFMAENIREHKIEHKRAKQFARSLLSDFKADTAALQTAINFGNRKIECIDSLVAQLDLTSEKWNDTLVYYYQGMAGRYRPFNHNSGTYEQMKASGSLRYFKQELTDLLNQYDVQAKKTATRDDIHLNYASNLLNPFVLKVVDIRAIIQLQDGSKITHKFPFYKKDGETIALWINFSTVTQSTQERVVIEYKTMMEKATGIIKALEKEYHLE